MEGYIVSLIIFTAIFAVFGLGLNLQWGFTGLLNFGHVAFMTLGAYTTAQLSQLEIPGMPTGLQIILAVLIGGGLAAILGLAIGVSTLRLREDYLAIVTIGVSEILRLIATNESWLTNGTAGVNRFPLPLGDLNPNLPLRIAMIAVLAGILWLGYARWWSWVRQQLNHTTPASLARSLPLVVVYLGTLSALLLGIGWGSKTLQEMGTLPNWAIGLGLTAALGIVAIAYVWMARRFLVSLAGWSGSLILIFNAGLALAGLWASRYAGSALYHYSRNPTKTGLMWISVVLVALLLWALEVLVRSPWGRVLKAVREDEAVAKALGKNVFWYKLQAFMLGGAIAGVAGALYAWQLTVVYPDNFQPLVTFNAWTIVVLGGAGNNVGTLLGAAIFWAYQTITRFILADVIPLDDARLGAFRIMLIGLLLMVLMVWRPQGILGKKEELTLGR